MTDHSKQIRAENRALHTRSMEHPERGALSELAPGFGVKRSGHYVYICDDDEPIASMYDGGASNAWSLATTLAAAPELLTALEALTYEAGDVADFYQDTDAMEALHAALGAAETAIKKARGQ